METLKYQLIIDQNEKLPETATKKHVDLVVKEVHEVIDQGELQVKIKALSNQEFAVSMAAQLPNDTLVTEKKGKKVIPLLKKVKKNLLRRLRGRRKKKRLIKRRMRRRLNRQWAV